MIVTLTVERVDINKYRIVMRLAKLAALNHNGEAGALYKCDDPSRHISTFLIVSMST